MNDSYNESEKSDFREQHVVYIQHLWCTMQGGFVQEQNAHGTFKTCSSQLTQHETYRNILAYSIPN